MYGILCFIVHCIPLYLMLFSIIGVIYDNNIWHTQLRAITERVGVAGRQCSMTFNKVLQRSY